MGYSIRTNRYRYTEWRNLKNGKVKARELYDHNNDPEENTNVAGAPCNEKLVATLAKMLKAGYQAASP